MRAHVYSMHLLVGHRITSTANALWHGPELRTSKLMKARSGVCASATLYAAWLVVAAFNSSNHVSHTTKLSCRLNHRSARGCPPSSAANVSFGTGNKPPETLITINLARLFFPKFAVLVIVRGPRIRRQTEYVEPPRTIHP